MNCHDIASRGIIGRQVFIEMHMIVEASDVETAHKITEEVEARLEARFNPVRVLIHIEPPDYKSVQNPVHGAGGLMTGIIAKVIRENRKSFCT
jgi:divalent metal cation (Fe/Co/Zn/Cd) transporter